MNLNGLNFDDLPIYPVHHMPLENLIYFTAYEVHLLIPINPVTFPDTSV
jgi:hypothetical protein